MYNKPFKIWDEDKLDAISKNDSYSSSSKYGSEKGGAGSVYNSNKAYTDEENKEKKAEEEGTLSSLLSQEAKREDKAKEDDIVVKAVNQVLAESKSDVKTASEDKRKESKKSIEEAINKAIKEEKEVIVLS